ncbi:MAG: LamG domain-containing protein, partial [Planctomycetaceae bacterium]
VFQTWIDGMGFSEDEFFPKGNPGNGTGAMVGYDPTAGNIMETATVHGGTQSMPVSYDSLVAATSEAERTFTDPQDWTGHGIKALMLWFCGNATNTASQMYVKVNGRKVAYDGDAASLLRKPWHLWYISLSQFSGVDLSKVTKLAIGFEGGKGLVFVDDIRLSSQDRQSVTPVKPDTANLLIHYALEGNTNSSAGTLHATAGGTPTYVPGKVGQAIKLNGATDYLMVEGSFNLAEYSAAMWFKVEGGTGTRDLVSIYSGSSHGVLLEITDIGAFRFLHRVPLGTSGGNDMRSNSNYADGEWYHMAAVKSATAIRLYINGEQAVTAADGTQFAEVLPQMTIGVLRHDSLSRFFPGTIDEFYLYNRTLQQAEIAYLAGLTKPLDK